MAEVDPAGPRIKHPHPDLPFPIKAIVPGGQGLTLRAPRSSSSTAAGWCGVGSPTPAARGCRTAPSSRPAASWRWLLSSGHPLSVGQTGSRAQLSHPGTASCPLCREGELTHPHGQGENAAAAEPGGPQRALGAAGHRDVALLVITCGRDGHQRRGAAPSPARSDTALTHPARTSRR